MSHPLLMIGIICEHLYAFTWYWWPDKDKKTDISGLKSASNNEFWYITPYLCKGSHVYQIWVDSCKRLGEFVIVYMHIHDIGGQLMTKTRCFLVQKYPESCILVYNTLLMQARSYKPYMSGLLQTIGRICDCLHARTWYWWPSTDQNQVSLGPKVPTIVHIGT